MNLPDHSTIADAASFYARGNLLREQDRHLDAIQYYQRALELDPNHAEALAMLAICYIVTDNKSEKSLHAAERAVTLEPENGRLRAILALAQLVRAGNGQKSKLKEAKATIEEAIQLDPYSDFSHGILADILIQMGDFPAAEKAAREALSINTENTNAIESLTVALARQGKNAETGQIVDYQLASNPDDAAAHTGKGWYELRQGNHKAANHHFLEALRLEANNESARSGLAESYRARSFFYGSLLRFNNWLSTLMGGRETYFFIGGFIVYRMLTASLENVSQVAVSLIIGAWLLFVFWGHLARSLGAFLMLFDRFARASLHGKEVYEAIIVGSTITGALLVFSLHVFAGIQSFKIVGLLLFFNAIVGASAFSNEHYIGKYITWITYVLTSISLVIFLSAAFLNLSIPPSSALYFNASLYPAVAISWLRAFRILYR